MFSNMDVFKIYSAMARHAADNQSVSARNLAHSDDPGFKASELESFQDYLARMATNPSGSEDFKIRRADTPASPNGNTVSIEQELYRSAEAMSQHEMALTVYTKSLDLLRTAMGKK
ncbi:flagellar biosynthesis protein FlgB [Henriciella sp. AS95]|uniref:flagellar biosynthesis protein FlgB n=1 Tax=Henriciella sp. AS95 TaxID=3135782 RepID=UPI0031804267